MTVMAERTSHAAQMTVEEFEAISDFAAKESDTVRLEFIGGRIGAKKMTDGKHGAAIMWLIRQCMQARPELDLNPVQGIKAEAYRKGRARPDAVLAPIGHFIDTLKDWAEAEGILMAVEITSYDSDTHARDRVEKPQAYAEAGIPVYLLIDRDDSSVTVHSDPDPEGGGYRDAHRVLFGVRVRLPDPVGFDLDTGELKRYVS
ncbi:MULTISPECIES: Uma2 family endonuclease [unclassified Streptomyces]|uniref:Uma2 family endonuclease n=1 Tax=unclassified Streptomyces TaxID=2593676 RepID=UPI00278C0259|nr:MULTISPECIES: Uma2 family endonuclease [unclassified Streptomyces]